MSKHARASFANPAHPSTHTNCPSPGPIPGGWPKAGDPDDTAFFMDTGGQVVLPEDQLAGNKPKPKLTPVDPDDYDLSSPSSAMARGLTY